MYPKDVRLVIKHFPLPGHNFARQAAIAAMAADKQGKFWEMQEKLFTNQWGLSDSKVEEIARGLGLNIEKFKEDLKDPGISSLIDRDLNNGRQINVLRMGTPSVFINGKLLTKKNISDFKEAIEAELKKKNRR